MTMTIFQEIAQFALVPVITIDRAEDALPLADALSEGGLPLAEITLRTPAGLQAIALLAKHRPQILLGAGTVLTEDQVDQSLAAGARFALAPGLDAKVLAHAKAKGLPFAPGIMTPSDLQAALRFGSELVKFFPAMPAGGPNMLKNIASPYAHTGIGFNPTGGVSLENLEEWLAIPQVRALGGTWIAKREDIAAGHWDKITANAKAALAKVKSARP